ncbi:MAG: SMI1/KNR4 family protein [Tepidisphaeraceae bacterium]
MFELNNPRDPASEEEIAAVESHVGLTFIDGLRQLYLVSDGLEPVEPGSAHARLMTLAEVCSVVDDMSSGDWFENPNPLDEGVVPLWDLFDGNYAALSRRAAPRRRLLAGSRGTRAHAEVRVNRVVHRPSVPTPR